MRLYHSPTTPFGRKVVVLLHETGQIDDVEIVEAAGSPVDPGTLPVARNPLGKIPALERPDGPALYDSRVICRYLDARVGGRLYPKEPRLWETLTLEATGDGMLDAAILMLYEIRLRPEEKRFDAWVDGQWSKISRALDALEAMWISHLNGPIDMGQVSVCCALSYLDFRHGQREWRAGHPRLATWHETLSGRDSMKATVPVG
ncbi:putative GST-like protein YibF [Defluviimonas aquaemixtae]|uniref:Putative GST-like protein YibF n=1 Tax=Albidovulum aquaemixtae TaxID=1542388 RepID=A0A2R8BK45_9RHOB|nr:glutathione S-transferase [Defluviimonas aquaemixtae]SPH23718.1 putative GST-like protein YibF [Defluviimonas aquaemixtae]